MKVVFVSSELAPWCKTGGLGDVIGALPTALEQVSGGAIQPISFLPFYRRVRERAAKEGIAIHDTGVVAETWLGGYTLRARILRPEQDGPPVYFVDHPGLYDREGIYDGERGAFQDNACLLYTSPSPRDS